MNIYLNPPQPSRGLQRIADALTRYRPEGATVVTDISDADLVILYVIGRQDTIYRQVYSLSAHQKYAVIQVCLRSTMRPDTGSWLELWDGAEATWSYYNLNAAVRADGHDVQVRRFYHAPLGADAEIFQVYPRWKVRPYVRPYVILSSGLSRLSESVRECHLAAQQAGKDSAHLGARLNLPFVNCFSDLPDNVLRTLYNQCQFISGLRRKEGFELPAAEGLLCGARPVLFNSKDYRKWYEPFGEFIEEGTRQEVVDQLVTLFRAGARPVTDDEIARARERFNWETIINGFYRYLK